MKVVFLTCLVATVLGRHEEYIGWKSYYVEPASQDQLQALGRMLPVLELDFLAHAAVGRAGVVLVSPRHQAAFTATLELEGISYRIHSADVKAQLDIDDKVIEKRRQECLTRNAQGIPYDNYQPLDVIYQYLEDIASKYRRTVTLVSPANSFEGHPIKYLKISNTNFEDTSKPVIVIDGGIHAREWISPPTVTYAIHKLVEDITEEDLLDDYDWILLPVVNPDGYKFSFESNRFWRKTRSTDQHVLSTECPGVDANRNFDFVWNSVGTNHSPCADTFAGSEPFSEIEARVVRDILHENLDRISLYLTMHSYGSMILYPWGHDGSSTENEWYLNHVSSKMADAVNEKALPNFPSYVTGNSLLVIGYGTSGAAEDYAQFIGIPFTYTMELPGLQDGFEGFNLEPQYIQQVCEETWAAIVIGARKSGELFRKSSARFLSIQKI